MNLAQQFASWSKDPSTQVGAVVVRDRRILASGFNGFPCGADDNQELYQHRETKLKRVVHAEANIIADAARRGVSLDGSILYVTHHPCSDCMGLILQSGITKVIFGKRIQGWCSMEEESKNLASEVGVELIQFNASLTYETL